jgi:plasmid stability protein
MSTTVLIPDDLEQQLRQSAHSQHLSVELLTRRLLREALDAEHTNASALEGRKLAAQRLSGLAANWSPSRDAVAELIAERAAEF